MKSILAGVLLVIAGCNIPITETTPDVNVVRAVYDGTSLSLDVRNDGSAAIEYLDCRLENYTPGREVENAGAEAMFVPRGGIELGETKTVEAFVMPHNSDVELTKGLDQGDKLRVWIKGKYFPVEFRPR